MAAPTWLAGILAGVMILTAAYSASRLALSRLRGRPTELDADGLHVLMGAAMAGMFVPRLRLLPAAAWLAVFGVAAAWFGWQTLRARGPRSPGALRCRYPVPHLAECAAMVYMLLAAHAGTAGNGMVMPGMGTSAGPQPGFPALAVVLTLVMLGSAVWTAERLTSRARPGAGGPALAPRLGAFTKIAMSITMGYMLFLMI
jgi:Domain of unknown function (DUF5134)